MHGWPYPGAVPVNSVMSISDADRNLRRHSDHLLRGHRQLNHHTRSEQCAAYHHRDCEVQLIGLRLEFHRLSLLQCQGRLGQRQCVESRPDRGDVERQLHLPAHHHPLNLVGVMVGHLRGAQ